MASRLLTYNEAADMLCVSVRTIMRYVSSGRLAVCRITRKTVLVIYPFRDSYGRPFSPPEVEKPK